MFGSVLKTLFDQCIFKVDSTNTKVLSTSGILVALWTIWESEDSGLNVCHYQDRKVAGSNLTFGLVSFMLPPFLPSFAFHIEISHFVCSAKQMTGFYMKCNTGLKKVKTASMLSV